MSSPHAIHTNATCITRTPTTNYLDRSCYEQRRSSTSIHAKKLTPYCCSTVKPFPLAKTTHKASTRSTTATPQDPTHNTTMIFQTNTDADNTHNGATLHNHIPRPTRKANSNSRRALTLQSSKSFPPCCTRRETKTPLRLTTTVLVGCGRCKRYAASCCPVYPSSGGVDHVYGK